MGIPDLQISDSDRLVLCAMTKALDRNVGYIVDALKAKVGSQEIFLVALRYQLAFFEANGGKENGS